VPTNVDERRTADRTDTRLDSSVRRRNYTSVDLPMQTLPRRRDLTTMAVRGSDFSSVIARDESSNKPVFLNESRMCLVVGTACPMRPVTPLKSLKTFKLLSCSLPFYAVFSKDIFTVFRVCISEQALGGDSPITTLKIRIFFITLGLHCSLSRC